MSISSCNQRRSKPLALHCLMHNVLLMWALPINCGDTCGCAQMVPWSPFKEAIALKQTDSCDQCYCEPFTCCFRALQACHPSGFETVSVAHQLAHKKFSCLLWWQAGAGGEYCTQTSGKILLSFFISHHGHYNTQTITSAYCSTSILSNLAARLSFPNSEFNIATLRT